MIFFHLVISYSLVGPKTISIGCHSEDILERIQAKNPFKYVFLEYSEDSAEGGQIWKFALFSDSQISKSCGVQQVYAELCMPFLNEAKQAKPYVNYNICVIFQRAKTYVFFKSLIQKNWRALRLYKLICYPASIDTPCAEIHPSSLIGVEQLFDSSSRLSKASENKLVYKFNAHPEEHQERKYLNLCAYILECGEHRKDRTGTGTIGIFGVQLHFDISESIPLMTTKRVGWKSCIEELLWFLRGDTDAKILQEKSIRIWDGNTSREFLDSRGLHAYEQGVLGPGYGWQWRFAGAEYDPKYADTRTFDRASITHGFDQIEWVIKEIRENPTSRRLVVNAWNVKDLDQMALPPCHLTFQFYVSAMDPAEKNPGNPVTETPKGKLNCHLFMRSNDLGCGFAFNIFSYAVLTYIIALKCDLSPGILVYSCSDAHIYLDHVEGIREQLRRAPTPSPKLVIAESVKDKALEEITIEDFQIFGYFPHPPIPLKMSV